MCTTQVHVLMHSGQQGLECMLGSSVVYRLACVNCNDKSLLTANYKYNGFA